MDKLKTKILLISLLLVLLFSVQSVAAVTDDNGNLTSESIDLSICDNEGDVSSDKLSSAYESNNPDDVLSASNELDALSVDEVPFTALYDEISSTNENVELQHDYYTYQGSGSTIYIYGDNRIIDGRGAVIDMEGSTIQAFFVGGSDITIKNLTIKNANYDVYEGAIYFSKSGTVENCNFTNNTSGCGGAVFFSSSGRVINCNFTNNKATDDNGRGGAIWFTSEGTVKNCNFVNNSARDGGAIRFSSTGNVTNCNFVNNSATKYDGGAIYFNQEGTVENCNFTNNKATGDYSYGGAILFASTGNVTNCNFIGNNATYNGGAILFASTGSVINCNFVNNSARYGGAIRFSSTGNVTNCNFIGNNVTYYGGAIYFSSSGTTHEVRNCNFIGNNATYNGGAILFASTGTVTNCNFTGNNAAMGSAIYFYSTSDNKTVSNSRFLNNRANAEALEVTKNDNNITITFKGNDNLLNAIYSRNDAEVTFTYVTYWSANGIATTGSSAIKPPRSNKEAGQNITLEIYDSDSLVDNVTLVTDDNGQVIYDLSKLGRGKYRYNAYHLEDSYYTYAEKNDTFTKGLGDFNILQSLINRADANSVLTLNRSYTFTIGLDENLTDGIVIDKPISINGNGYTINALQKARIFNVTSANVVLNNITFTNATASGSGGAVYFSSSGSVINCNFTNNTATNGDGGAIWMYSGSVENCNFVNNSATKYDGGAIYFNQEGTVENCNFTNNKATGDYSYGGAILFASTGNVTNCNFTNNKATGDYSYGGAILFASTGSVINCNFTDNTASGGGGAVFVMYIGEVTNCNFTNNSASDGSGGAINIGRGTVTNCNFTDNIASRSGGAIWITLGTVTNCNFTDNIASSNGGAISISGNVTKCNFTDNIASRNGGAIIMNLGNVTNCNFTGNNATNGSAIYYPYLYYSGTKTVSNSCFLNNRADAEDMLVTKNNNNITITFTGNDNLLNAIYSYDDAEVTFINVTYWGANVIANTDSSAPSRSNKEAGQNITVIVVVNDEIVLNKVKTTDENGMIVLDIKAGENYYITARHETDSYYTEAERTISNMTFNVNVTSQTTNNKTVNITAKSNILNEVMPGKLLFILPNGEEISANYGGNGTWWALHTFDDYGVYEVNASYTGLDNVTINNGTITIKDDVKLSVVKSANVTEVAYNSPVQFTINVTNYGSADATSVEVSDWLPEGLTFIEAGVINSEGQYEVFDSPDLLILIDDESFVTFNEFSSSDIIEDGGVERDIAQWSITRIAGGNSVILLITARANGLVMGNITNEVTVWYHENETDSIVNSTNITVIPANSSVSAEDVEVTYGDSIVVVVTSENATGVSYMVIGKDGVVKEGTVNVGENITGLDLAAGDYTVNLTTMVNGNYSSSNYTSKITVSPANSSVSAEDVEVTYGDSIVVVVTSDNATGVSYMVIGKDGVVKEGTVNVGENITGLDLAAGDYTVNLTTVVNSNYTAANYTSKITVKPANSSVKAEDVEVTYGDAIVVVVTSENTTKVSYQIISSGNVVKEGTVNVGENITGLDLAAGEYTVNLTTVVNGNYTANNYTSKITVNPAGSSVSAEDTVASFGEAISIPVSSVNATEISYSIIDANNKSVANGTVKPDEAISVFDLAAGDFTVSLTTVVDTNHTSVSNSSKLHIKHVVSIVIAPVTGYAGEVVNFTAQFKYENGDPVSEGTAGLTIRYEDKKLLAASMYSILSADESSPVSNGKATFNVKLGNPGIYPYVISYSGGDANNVQAESTLTVLKVNTAVSGIDVSGKPSDKKDVTVSVLDHNNNPVTNGTVTLTLNGKTYNSTVENGKAVLSIELPNPGSYNASVTYYGNDYYNSSSSSIAVDVEKVNTNVPSAEDVSGKAGEKTDISVKFVDENGNPVKNGAATLTIDGKTYTAEVTKGVAIFKDVVLPDNDTVADVYYHGNDYYNASSATFSIKVKQNNTEPDSNNTDENKTVKHVSSNVVDGNATGNPIAMMLLALFVMVITYRKK